jgi:cytochrome P450
MTPDNLPVVEADLQRYLVDREAVLAEIAREHDVIRTLFGVQFLRRDDVVAALRDRRVEARIALGLESQGITSGQLYEQLSTSLLNMNGPEHLRLRSLVLKAFTPTAIERYRPAMRELAEELVDDFAWSSDTAGETEFMESFANHYPVQVICTLLGVPREDHDHFRHWLDTVSFSLSMLAAEKQDDINVANTALAGYVRSIVEARRSDPGDDLITALLHASDGDDRLTLDEVVRMVGGLLFAGHDTTRNQLGRAMVAFAEHPREWQRLRDDPTLTPQAVDEVTRLFPVVDGVSPRQTSAPVTIGGVELPAGTVVNPCTYGGNIDRAVYGPDAEVFDVAVTRAAPPLTFGGGAHLCIGINLAKAEMAEAFQVLSRRMPNLRLAGDVVWPPAVGIWGPTSVPLAWG